MGRQSDGRETWHRLLNWDKGQTPSERLAAQVLIYEKYESIDPSHPLGGRDGLKDIICKKDSMKFVTGCYFPRGQETFSVIKKKFLDDVEGVSKNNSDGIVFITNQELRLSEREELHHGLPTDKHLDLYHLERLTAILNSPINYGTRLEFLDIEMSKEEQLAYMASKDQIIHDLMNLVKQIIPKEIKEEKIATPVSVQAEKYEVVDSIGLKFDNPYHKCSYCGYGFKIVGRQLGAYYIDSGSLFSNTRTLEVVTCPKCGNTENAS